ncbi:maleylpyruvate isomerase family mycothiol-dependent enzyme [Actinomadura darangshiensis]|uniref:Maleylpyruvate isomerase family mycothiol-dependent enzyme n=1 Tax=Actinomadura darangshiensis TaxID=705336 RepID=A0A4R5A3Z2_9ACTN|nr:maleylpyruvate isomerase family mycothiol-dependent enzyme [Actinomadura darangshiensis]TDD66668.1 maleylpyruvate isomerase family mycothiol-dependent enzyme [Actinomadura darangshiensis]
MDVIEAERFRDGLREHTRGLAEATAVMDPSAQVRTCPEWTMRDLVGHVGQAHRWAAHLVRTGGTEVVDELPRTTPDSSAEWSGWLRDGVEDLIGAQEADPDGSVEHPLLGTRSTLMWLRRMTHDTSVHRVDAALTAGLPYSIESGLAADAISEFLGLLASGASARFKPELAELRGDGETLCARPAEPSVPGWVITRTAGGPVWERGTGDAGVTVAGPVQNLLLVFARRLAPDGAAEVKVTGDRSLLDHWLAHTAV